MELVNYHRPHRAIIRCKAKMQLLKIVSDRFDWDESDVDALLEELAATLFQSERYWALYEHCHSKQEAKAAEDQLATELAETYQIILKRRQNSVVQSFNALFQDGKDSC